MPSKPQRLFVTSDLAPGASVELDPAQAHYLINVLRCKTGEEVLLFNGKDGEWLGRLERGGQETAQSLPLPSRPGSKFRRLTCIICSRR